MSNALRNLLKQPKRAWRIFISPPRESREHASLETLPIMFERSAVCATADQPKQVAISDTYNLAFVSCMEGSCVQIFNLRDLRLINTLPFDNQCVEVAVDKNRLFVTTTNFDRVVRRNMLYIVDIPSQTVIGSINPEGNWNKVIAVSPDGNTVLVSNWHTHDVSVVDIRDPNDPHLLQRVACGESPRGLVFVDNSKVLAACFYSGTIVELTSKGGEGFSISHKTIPFGFPTYSGNPRDIVLDPTDKDVAWVSNLGRNLVHRYSISKKRITDSVLVGKEPNSIRFSRSDSSLLLISCRASNTIVALNTKTGTLVGKSSPTGNLPTGLETFEGGFLATGLNSDTLEKYEVV